jgi:lipopolysaccharide transport system ATP-binding protein
MSKASVMVEGLSKKFGLSLKSALKYGFADSFRRLTGRGKNTNLRSGEFWALQDVNFTLEPGDALGIMGVNGSGKTTLLRILNGSYTPDAGKAVLRGRIGALIAAGAGFSPLLTGRENVFISGTLLGMSPAEIRKKFDEIVAFADLGEFIDMPIRNYSSGMSVRLGFAVAVLGSPEILLVDEVLAVGDLSFQKKCYERIFALKKEGTTILLVSHSPGAIWAVCNKGLVLHNGEASDILSVEVACKLYDKKNFEANNKQLQRQTKKFEVDGEFRGGTGDAYIFNLRVCNVSGQEQTRIAFGEPFCFKANLQVNNNISNSIYRISINTVVHKGVSVLDSYEQEKNLYELIPGCYEIIIKIPYQNFRPGTYSFSDALACKDMPIMLYFNYNSGSFIVEHSDTDFLYAYDTSYMHLDANFSINKIN